MKRCYVGHKFRQKWTTNGHNNSNKYKTEKKEKQAMQSTLLHPSNQSHIYPATEGTWQTKAYGGNRTTNNRDGSNTWGHYSFPHHGHNWFSRCVWESPRHWGKAVFTKTFKPKRWIKSSRGRKWNNVLLTLLSILNVIYLSQILLCVPLSIRGPVGWDEIFSKHPNS